MVNIGQLIVNLGKKLGFEVETQVPASESAWVDVVWYDNRFRFPKPSTSQNLLRIPKLPVVGFEIERKTGTSPKRARMALLTQLNSKFEFYFSISIQV